MFPKFLIRKMYKKESLKLTAEGFSFIIKNNLANGNVIEVHHLHINDIEIPFENITLENETLKMSAADISSDTPMKLTKKVDTIFSCVFDQVSTLLDQEVKVEMKFIIGVRSSKMTIDFDFKDTLRPIS